MARLTYAEPADLPADKRHLLDTLSDADVDEDDRDHSLEGGTLNVYRTLGRNVDLLEGFREYGSLVWAESGLTPTEREVLILATAFHTNSTYEWHQHVRVALDEGIDPATIRAISTATLDELDPAHAAVVEYVAAFVDGEVDDADHDRLADHYDEETIVGIGALCGFYLGLSRLLAALDVDVEAPFVGWELENL